jgi:hypothetical protein
MIPATHGFVLAVDSSLAALIVAKVTVIVACGLIGVRLLRRNRAAVRHVMLAAAFGVILLLPVASLIAPPVRIVVPAARHNAGVFPALRPSTRLCLRPGERNALNSQVQETWIKSAGDFRKMRGDVLVACFQVENVCRCYFKSSGTSVRRPSIS